MFGEYAHIASFLSPREGIGNLYSMDAMPEYLRPVYQPPHPWNNGRDKSGLTEDFIMIAEFSELEGPKPLMTIPKEGAGLGFDQNSFAVRILAVDHQTSSSQGFTISEDAQVVLSDVDAGVFAFVHHLVLYDNTARGFVRPHCIAYITSDQRKLMTFYEEMSCKFKKVARCIKYGNLLLFVADLERHLKDLGHTKGFLLNQVSKQRLKDGDSNSDMRKNADNELHRKLQSIHQSTSEIKEILSILKPLLSDKRLEARFRLLEERAFHRNSMIGGDKLSLQENWFNDMSSLDGFDIRCGSLRESQSSPLSLFKPRDYKPLLVETKKAKRFNAPLRGLHELCSWGAKEGLKKLRSLYAYFKRDMVLLELEKMESKLMKPMCTSIYHGQCVTGNLLAGIHMKQHSAGFDEDEEFSMLQNTMWTSTASLESTDSFKSADSFSSALTANNASPESGHTNESLNGNLFQSAPSSLDKNDISLLMEDEYYGESSECVCKDGDDTNGSCGQNSNNQDIICNDGNSMKESKERIDMSDFDEPPVIIFKEKIKRPLSVVSLGCTDDENDSAKEEYMSLGSLVSSNLSSKECGVENSMPKDKEETVCDRYNSKMENMCDNICNVSLETSAEEIESKNKDKVYCSSCSDNSPQAEKVCLNSLESLTTSNTDAIPVNNDRDLECTKGTTIGIKQCHSDSPAALSISPCDSNLTIANSYSSCIKCSKPSCSSPNNGIIKENTGKTIICNCNNSTSTIGVLSDSTSSSLSSSLPSSMPQLEPVFGNQDEDNKCVKSVNSFHPDIVRKYSYSPSSLMQKHPSPQTSSSASTIIQRQISAATSSNMSDFTDISIRDLFPYLTDVDSNGSIPPDAQSAYGCGEGFDASAGIENVNNGNSAVNPSIWRPRHGLYTVGDWLNNINRGRTGYGILEVLNGYSNLQHAVFSLMIGRPVLVVGVAKLEPEVLKIINALAVFIPSTKKRQQYVLEWTSKHLRISDLAKLRLIGLCRDDRKVLDSFIPSVVKKASTVIDVEKRTIFAPHYQGNLIPSLLAKKKNLKTDAVMLSYIHWWLMDILGKAFIFFHSFYLGSAGSMMSSSNLREHRDSYRATVNGIMGRLGIKDSDCSIVEYLAELTKLSRLESAGPQRLETDNATQPLRIHYTPCQVFKC